MGRGVSISIGVGVASSTGVRSTGPNGFPSLKPDGILVIDHLTYDRIFAQGAFDSP